jgi:hypothetical protein
MSLGKIRLLEDCPAIAVVPIKLSDGVLHVVSLEGVIVLEAVAAVIVLCNATTHVAVLVSVAFVIGSGILLINRNSFPDVNASSITVIDFALDFVVVHVVRVRVVCWHAASLWDFYHYECEFALNIDVTLGYHR